MTHRFITKLSIFGLFLFLWSCNPAIISPSTNTKVQLSMGNPTNATESESNKNNYLVEKPQYAMSYNEALHHANWVSWELSTKWLGSVDRSDDFRPDDQLPSTFYKVLSSDYTSSGFDRGHLCPSADRTSNQTDNSATFLMSNIIPQSPTLNREAWANLESYCRKLANQGYLLYIVAGVYGTGGNGSKGDANTIKNDVNIPERVYKIILATDKTNIDNVDKKAIIIAADFPNSDEVVANRDWVRFLTPPADIEKSAKISLFSSLSSSLQSEFRTRFFDYEQADVPIETTCQKYNNRTVYVGTSGGCFYFNSSGNKAYVDKKYCDCQ